jgi:hypothetical protein
MLLFAFNTGNPPLKTNSKVHLNSVILDLQERLVPETTNPGYQNPRMLQALMENDVGFAQNLHTPPRYFKCSLDYLLCLTQLIR